MGLQEPRDQTQFQVCSHHMEIGEEFCEKVTVPALELGSSLDLLGYNEAGRKNSLVLDLAYAARTSTKELGQRISRKRAGILKGER